ncbi:hypothetical protein FT643_14915 [Ketobacter sp. MCCC 1A13808]|nr:hypothetical protein [Ketobacter sp. MCCC 1A13808]
MSGQINDNRAYHNLPSPEAGVETTCRRIRDTLACAWHTHSTQRAGPPFSMVQDITRRKQSADTLPLVASANRALTQFIQLTDIKDCRISGSDLLYERRLLHSLATQSPHLALSSCRLLSCADRVLAVNLPRDLDWELLPAWLGPWRDHVSIKSGDWSTLADYCRQLNAADLLAQAHLLGMAVATADQLPPPPSEPVHRQPFHDISGPATRRKAGPPVVLDLSSLWAGPLCGYLLQQAGCRVIKVEGLNRLDGARRGLADFYHLLNQGKESVVLDFKTEAGIKRLKQLIAIADIVIEASRPRALRNMGIFAEQLAQTQPGLVWLSITGYGRNGGQEDRIGFGDDAAAAAGLSQVMFEATGDYQIVGDAIADPLTGIQGALAGWRSHLAGGNAMLSVSLFDTVSYCLHQELHSNREAVLQSCRQWSRNSNNLSQYFAAGPRLPTSYCASPGQHNEAIFSALDHGSLT